MLRLIEEVAHANRAMVVCIVIFRIMTDDKIKIVNGKAYVLVFAKSITRNGKTIYPKKSEVFRFWVTMDKVA